MQRIKPIIEFPHSSFQYYDGFDFDKYFTLIREIQKSTRDLKSLHGGVASLTICTPQPI